jgi:hypothetical protein
MAANPGRGAINYDQQIKMNNPDHDTFKPTVTMENYGFILNTRHRTTGTPGYTWLQVVHFK